MDENKSMAQAVEELAELQFTPAEIAIICETSETNIKKKYYTAFRRGSLRAQAAVRQSILQMAKQGSTPAQKEFQALVFNAQKKEI